MTLDELIALGEGILKKDEFEFLHFTWSELLPLLTCLKDLLEKEPTRLQDGGETSIPSEEKKLWSMCFYCNRWERIDFAQRLESRHTDSCPWQLGQRFLGGGE